MRTTEDYNGNSKTLQAVCNISNLQYELDIHSLGALYEAFEPGWLFHWHSDWRSFRPRSMAVG